MTKEEWYQQLFSRLEQSKFRSSFHLKEKDKAYIREKGMDVWIPSGVTLKILLQREKHLQ